MSAGTDLVRRPEEQAVHGLQLAAEIFTPELRGQIAAFLQVDATEPALPAYLAICASYGLDPVMGQVWLIPQRVKVRDGDSDSWQNKYRPACGRDGYLAIARRDPRYKGMKYAVIHERDTFEVEYDGSPDEPRVLHRFASKPTVFEEGADPTTYRGRIIGAWAKAYIEGQPPEFYIASLREHGRTREEWEGKGAARHKTGKIVWDGAWGYTSTMILKAAQSYVLRIGLGITGLVPADELASSPEDAEREMVGAAAAPAAETDLSFIEDEELRERLTAAVEGANSLAPMSWAPARCEMVFRGRTVEELTAYAEQIEHEVELLARRVDPPEGAVAEAEVVPDGQSAEGEPGEQAPEEEVAGEVVATEALTEEQSTRLDGLRSQAADLQAGLDAMEPGTESHASLAAELDQVEAEIRQLGGGVPGQGDLGL